MAPSTVEIGPSHSGAVLKACSLRFADRLPADGHGLARVDAREAMIATAHGCPLYCNAWAGVALWGDQSAITMTATMAMRAKWMARKTREAKSKRVFMGNGQQSACQSLSPLISCPVQSVTTRATATANSVRNASDAKSRSFIACLQCPRR